MNEPKRLLAESQSSLTHELLLAARGERLSDELRSRMADGLALTLGATSIGAGLTLGAHAQGAATGLEASGLGGASGITASVSNAPGALVLGSGALTSSGSVVTASAGATLWLKGVVAMSVLAGAVGLGSAVGLNSAVTHWVSPIPEDSSSRAAARSSFEATPAGVPADSPAVTPAGVQGVGAPATGVEGAAPRADLAGDVAVPTTGADEAERAARRPRSKTKTLETAAVASGDLDREVRLLDAARRAILAGDISGAREKLAQYSRAFPQGALRGEAASLAKAAANAQ